MFLNCILNINYPFYKNESSFYTGSFDKILRLWSIEQEKVIDYTHTPDFITCLAFSPNKINLVMGFNHGYIRIYRINNVTFTILKCKAL